MAKIPTIKVRHPSDKKRCLVINETDFDPDVHTPWDAEAKAQARRLGAGEEERDEAPAEGEDAPVADLADLAAAVSFHAERIASIEERLEALESRENEAGGGDDGAGTPPEGGTLPEDFPSRDELVEAGLDTLAKVRAADDLTVVNGIGPARAKEIAEQLDGRD
ncbi:MAG: hypothetical protein ACODAA_06655 [Gemmatimonadota bacterium]